MEAFLDACRKGNLPKTKVFLTGGCSPNVTDRWGQTPLIISATYGHANVVSYLIASGANVNKKYFGQTVLHVASERGHLKMVESLLDAGAKIDEVDRDHSTPLMLAVHNRHMDVVHHLVNSGANVDEKDCYNQTALHMASERGHLKMAEALLNTGGKIDEVDKDHSTPLMLAARTGHVDVATCLVNSGANVDKKDRYNQTALHMASKRGHLKMVEVLLTAGAKIDEVDTDQSTPLMLAASEGHHNIVSHLGSNSANVGKKDRHDQTALHLSSAGGHLKVVETLLKAGAKIDEVDADHSTPLMLAASRGYVYVVSYLLDYGADVTKHDHFRDTALHIAAHRGQLEIVKLLLSKGAELDQETIDSCTPLVLAILKNNHDVMLHLIASGADVAQLARGTYYGRDLGREALLYVITHKHVELAKILITKGVGIEGFLSTSPPMTALMWTAQEGYDSLMKEIILQGVNVNHQNPYGYTALHFASQHNHIQCGILLVEAGADMSIENKATQTPLDLSSNEFKDVILQSLSFQTKKTVCVIGNAMSGKSTLIASLQNENASFVKKIRNWLFGVQDISERTAGIEPVSLKSEHYGDVMFFDFAGQDEYHGPHEMFLEAILSKGLSTVTIIVVVKATEEESSICHQLNRWLHPFTKMSSTTNPVRVIVIASHMDKVKRKVEAKEKLEVCYKKVKDSLHDVPLKFEDLCYLDCRQPYSNEIYKLCTYLRDVPPPQYKARDTAYSICWVISRIRSSFEDKVISVLEFSDWIAHNKANLPTNLPPAEEVCKDLSSTGHFLYLPSKEGTSNGWLVLDLPSILHELYGTLFSPFEGCRSRIVDKFGLLSIQKLKEIFPSLNLEMICNVLVSLEFCIEVESSTLKKLKVSVSEGVQESPEHLFFPALVSSQCPKSFEHTSPSPHTLCWQLVAVEGEYFISPRLLQTIILRLAADHVFRHQRGSITQEYDCSVWQNGIFWQSTKDVDVAVQITDNAVVQVIGSCGFDPKAATTYDPDILFRYISTIIQDIIGTICDLSPHLSGGTYMIHPVNPQALLENPRSPSPQEMFPVDFILESRRNNATTCRPLEGIRKAISDVFGGFEPSVDVTARLLMPQYPPPLTNQLTGSTTSTNPLPTASSDPLPTILDDPLRTTPTHPAVNTSDVPPLSRPSKADSDPLPTSSDPFKTTPTDPLLTTPTINKLQQLVVQDIALDWFSVGLQLDIKVSVLNIIEADVYPHSVERCCCTMFTRWLAHDNGTGGEPRVWRTVLKALKNAGYMTLVGDVEKTLFEQK